MQRREFFKGFGALTAAAVVLPSMSFAADAAPKGPNEFSVKQAVDAIVGNASVEASAKVDLKAPEIAENGAVVPVTVEVNHPMNEGDYVKSIHIFATKNNNVRCIDAHFTPANGKAMLATRIKLGSTQDVMALVALSNGKFLSATQNVKVTIGGCG